MRIQKPVDSDLDKADHTVFGLKKLRDAGYTDLRAYAGSKSSVRIGWNLNEACERDAVFSLRVGNEEVYLSKEEMMRALRWT